MSHTSPLFPPATGRRRSARAARVALAAGLVSALAVTGALPAFAAESDALTRSAADKPIDEKFGTHDATLLAEAKAAGEPHVTLMIATEPGQTDEVSDALDAIRGASVGYTLDEIGYVRATVRTGAADEAIDEARALSSVYAIDLNEEIQVPDPLPDTELGRGHGSGGGNGTSYQAPDATTKAANPYQPSHETGAVDFVKQNKKYDGRGITIGILDTGVDLAHPSLQETTTGERKVTDWVTATDPIIDSDGSWRPMTTAVSGETFSYNGRDYKAPAGDYYVSIFRENIAAGELGGDVNRDGRTDGAWAVLYDPAAGTVRVDLNDDGDFTDEAEMKPYRENHDIGYFGTDNPDTEIAESVPFVVEIREDVPMDPYGGDWIGETRDFVNIGIVSGRHGTHVAGITAANSLFGGQMNGAAPGAQVVSSRACRFNGGCTATAMFEGMIDLVVNRDVDLVNVSIGGLPALNDGNNARARVYSELIDTYDVQLFISAGNDGPGVNTVSDPSVAEKVVSVGAAISKETWAANYGSGVTKKYAMLPFSSAGPRADGGFKPTITGPGASINTIPTWQPGAPVAEAGYALPPGYGMLQGTSMSSPQVAGAAALLLSGAKQRGIELSAADLRTALTSSADPISGVQAHEQGAGLMDTVAAWKLITKGATAHEYTVKAPVSSDLAEFLATPGFGTGVYDRESAPKVGERKTYDITLTRTSGPNRNVQHKLTLDNNHDKTFSLVGSSSVSLPLNKPVTVKVQAKPRSAGAHSVLLGVDDRSTKGVDLQVLSTILVTEQLAGPSYAVTKTSTVQRNASTSYFIKVPEGTKSLEVKLDGLTEGSQTRWIAITPWGTLADNSSTVNCYPNYTNPSNTCRPDLRSYENPTPGVWEIEVEARRTSPHLDNPYTMTATALGTVFEPGTVTVEEATVGTPLPVSWEVSNTLAPIEGSLSAGDLGSVATDRPTIETGAYQTSTVELAAGVTRFEAVIGGTSDPAADLDLYVYRDGTLVGQSASGGSEESVVLTNPAAGTYTVEVHAYAIPSGSTAYDYRDAYLSPELGTVAVDEEQVISLASGASAEIDAEVTVISAAGDASAGREFFGEVKLLNATGTVTGSGGIIIEKVSGS
ncbi:S8 family serine peptidase [Streptomyces xiamenensis]|uniref:S8 family serine peptidase n=1 Tax=Streptomyces xiamenensis TaxID=408015 RepID=UPI00368C9F7A